MGFMKVIRSFIHELDEAVFPSGIYCLCCGSMIDRSRTYSLCDSCIRRFHWITGPTCAKCGKALAEREPDSSSRLCYDCMMQMPVFKKGFSCLTYGLHERELMMDLKYAGRGYVARRCGDMMFDRIEGEIRHGLFSSDGSPIDMIVPVPISADRLIERGYNQSELMAIQLAARWKDSARDAAAISAEDLTRNAAPVLTEPPVLYTRMLYRTRGTRKLRGLNPAERALELEGVFKVRDGYAGRLKGAKVLLVDDIHTTGATANACAKALLDAGASEVYFLSWASGGNRKPSEQTDIQDRG